jgi:hypothetical protein
MKKFINLLSNDSFKTLAELLVLLFAVLGIWLAKYANDAAIAANQAAMAANEISRAALEEMQNQFNKAFEPELVAETTHATVHWAENADNGIFITGITAEVERLGAIPSFEGIPVSIVNIGQGTARDIAIRYQSQPFNDVHTGLMDALMEYYRAGKAYYDIWEAYQFDQQPSRLLEKPFLLGNVQESWQFDLHREVIAWLGYTLFDIRGSFLNDSNHPGLHGILIDLSANLEIEYYDMQGRHFTEQRVIEIRHSHSMWYAEQGNGVSSVVIRMIKP